MRNRLAAMAGAEVRIGISKHALTILRRGAFGKDLSLLHNEQSAEDTPMESVAARCRAALAQISCSGLPLSITLGDELVRLFMVTPPQNATGMQDLAGAASMRFQSLFGETARDWQIDADWRARTPFLTCALPRTVVEHCTILARDLRMPLTVLQPHFIAAWNLARGALAQNSDGAWLAVLHGTQLSLGMVAPRSKRVSAIRGFTVPAERGGQDWLQEQMTRAALQSGLTAPSRLLLAGDTCNEWTDTKQGTLEIVRFEKETMPGTRLTPAAVPVLAQVKVSSP